MTIHHPVILSNLSRSKVFAAALFLLPFAVIVPGNCRAQELSLFNLDRRSVESLVGPPDEQIAQGESERLKYGESEVFLSRGKVVAWSDKGDLGRRRDQRTTENVLKKTNADRSQTWSSGFPYQEQTDVEEVLDELMK